MRVYRDSYKDRRTGKRKTSKAWTVEFTHAERVRRVVGFTDKALSEELGRKIGRLIEFHDSSERLDPTLARWTENLPANVRDRLAAIGLLDERRLAAMRPLFHSKPDKAGEPCEPCILRDFGDSLSARNRTGQHVGLTVERVRRLLESTGAHSWSRLDPRSIELAFHALRERGLSAKSLNHYVGAMRQFCRFVVARGWGSEDPSRLMEKWNVEVDRRRVRDALDEDEVRRLLEATERAEPWRDMTGHERALLYRLCIETGLRRNEVRSLRVSSFTLEGDAPLLRLSASASKRRKDDVILLRPSLARALEPFLRGRKAWESAFHIPKGWRSALMISADLATAKITRDAEEGTDVLDFHSLRHTFVSLLNRARVGAKVMQSLARHSTPTLTLGVYSHLAGDEDRRALDLLPDFTTTPALAATGTMGVDRSASCSADEPWDAVVVGPRSTGSGPQHGPKNPYEACAHGARDGTRTRGPRFTKAELYR